MVKCLNIGNNIGKPIYRSNSIAFLQIFVIFLFASIFQLNIKKPSCNQHVPSNILRRMSNMQATPKNMQSLFIGKYALLQGMQGCRPKQNSNTSKLF